MKTSVKVSCVHNTPPLSFHYKGNIRKKLACQGFKCDRNFQKEGWDTNAIGWNGKKVRGLGEKNTAL